jgi:hypothetical protein
VVLVLTGLVYVGAAALTNRGKSNSWLFAVADGHIGTVHIMFVDGHNYTVDSRFRFLFIVSVPMVILTLLAIR